MGRHRTLLDLKGPAAPQTISHSDLLVSNKDGGDLEGPVGGPLPLLLLQVKNFCIRPLARWMDGWMEVSPPKKIQKAEAGEVVGKELPAPPSPPPKKTKLPAAGSFVFPPGSSSSSRGVRAGNADSAQRSCPGRQGAFILL